MNKIIIMSLVMLASCSPTTAIDTDGEGNGAQGPTGARGEPGFNSVIKLVQDAPTCAAGGVTIISALDVNRSGEVELGEDQQVRVATVCHGSPAQGPFSAVEIMDPCGDHPTKTDEILIRLADGRVLVSFSDTLGGDNTRLSLLQGPGNFQTTDGTNCVFSIDANGRLL